MSNLGYSAPTLVVLAFLLLKGEICAFRGAGCCAPASRCGAEDADAGAAVTSSPLSAIAIFALHRARVPDLRHGASDELDSLSRRARVGPHRYLYGVRALAGEDRQKSIWYEILYCLQRTRTDAAAS